jgi:hypothetical protein
MSCGVAPSPGRDPDLIERAKVVHTRQADQFAVWPRVDPVRDTPG